METRELQIIGEWQVDMHALQIGPAVASAIEDTIEGRVDFGIVARPQ